MDFQIISARAEHIPSLRLLWSEVFGDTDELLDTFFEKEHNITHSLCAIADGKAVGMLHWLDFSFENQKIAYIYAVAVSEDYRNNGIFTRLLQSSHDVLRDTGYAFSSLVPASDSLFETYASRGYLPLTSVGMTFASAKKPGVALHPIGCDEYIRERIKYLPEKSVNQHLKSDGILNQMYSFARGDGFILAYRREGERVFCPEILGERKDLSGIVSALGLKEGVFRHCCGDKPFSMYFPLTSAKLLLPDYFGFAFD